MSTAYLRDRITRIQAQITAVEDAILAIATGQVSSYSLDTGQGKQTVTKASLPALNALVDSLLNRLSELQLRCGDGGSLVRPLY